MKLLPNILTVMRILMTPFFVYCLLDESYQIYAVLLFVVASITDWYDGYLARKYASHSEWGKFLDPLADKVLVLAAFSSFVYLGVVKLWMVLVIVIRDFMITYLRSYALKRGRPMMTSVIAKIKTAAQMVMINIILAFIAIQSIKTWEMSSHVSAFVLQYQLIYLGMLIVTTITALSGILYLYDNRRSLLNSSISLNKN